MIATMTSHAARPFSGVACARSGRYVFDGYLDGTRNPPPQREEMFIHRSSGEVFPPIRSVGRACWWRLACEDDEEAACSPEG